MIRELMTFVVEAHRIHRVADVVHLFLLGFNQKYINHLGQSSLALGVRSFQGTEETKGDNSS